jgi:FkbM family methyltransferase
MIERIKARSEGPVIFSPLQGGGLGRKLKTTFDQYIKYGMKRLLPATVMIRFLSWIKGFPEPELRLLPYLCEKSKISIDIGASDGLYTLPMIQYSKKCYAFEPRIKAATHLAELLSELNTAVQVEPVALSDHRGKTYLKVFLNDLGRSTIEDKNLVEKLGAIELTSVPVRRLDDYSFNESIGCIKIDVEGHEEAVLRGARLTLQRHHPALIIEIEERHNFGSVSRVNNLLKDLDYMGFFFHNHRLEPMNHFQVNINQHTVDINNSGKYINNFIFLPESSLPKIKDLLLC